MISSTMRVFISLMLTLVLLVSFVSACTPAQTPKFGFNPKLTISEPPVLGKSVKVTLTFTPQKQFETYKMQIELAPGVYEVLEGDLELNGITGDTHSMEITIKSIKTTGSGEIVGRVWGLTPHTTPNEYAYLFIQITNNDATVSTTQPKFSPQDFTPQTGSITPHTKLLSPADPNELSKLSTTINPSYINPAGGNSPQKPVVGFNPELSLSEAPILGKPVRVILTFSTPLIKGLENQDLYYTARIELPPNVYEIVRGELEQKGKFSKGIQSLEITIKSVRTGVGTISARVAMRLSQDDEWGTSDVDYLFIQISKNDAVISENQPANMAGEPHFDANDRDKRPEDNLITVVPWDEVQERPSDIPLLTPPVSANTTAKYHNSGLRAMDSFVHPLTIYGEANCDISKNVFQHKWEDETKPIVWGTVEVFDSDNHYLESTLTGYGSGQSYGYNAGEYCITIENPYPLGFYIRIKPESGVAIVYSDGWGNHYNANYNHNPVELIYDTILMPDATPSSINNNYKGAWRIYETLANDVYDRGAWNFLVNSSRGPHDPPPTAYVYYPLDPFPVADPPYYDSWTGTKGIYLDEEDHTKGLDIIQHEYAHYIMHGEMYGYAFNSPIQPAIHYLWQAYKGEIAWTEGWADFFPLVVQDDKYLGDELDSNGDIENKDWNSQGSIYNGQQWIWSDCEDGDEVEGRVAGALWDIYDSDYDGYDTFSNGFSEIWESLCSSPSNVSTFANYWNVLKAQYPDQQPANRALFQNTIAYDSPLYLNTSVNPPSAGTVTRNPNLFSYPYDPTNPSVTLTASWNQGWTFDHWSGNLSGSVNPSGIIMDGDKSVTANFKGTPVFSNLSSPTITQGTSPTVLGGNIQLGGAIPTGNVNITLNGVQQAASINQSNGDFSSSFNTSGLRIGNYQITYSYAGDPIFYPRTDTSKSLIVTSNGLVNPSFENGTPPTGWISMGGAVLARDSAHVINGSNAAKITGGGVNTGIYQYFGSSYDGKQVTVGCWIWCNTPNTARITTWGGAYSAYHPGDSQWHYITVVNTIVTGQGYVFCIMDNSSTAWFDDYSMILNSNIVNPSFEIGNPPSGWTTFGGAVLTRGNTHIYNGSYAGKIVGGGVNTGIYQNIGSGYDNKQVTIGCWVWCSTPNTARLNTFGGAYSAYHPGDGAWHYLSVTNTILPGNEYVYCIMDNTGTAWFDEYFLYP
jgi:hypothetical protein